MEEPDPYMDLIEAVWAILDVTEGSEGFVHDIVQNGIRSWKQIKGSQ